MQLNIFLGLFWLFFDISVVEAINSKKVKQDIKNLLMDLEREGKDVSKIFANSGEGLENDVQKICNLTGKGRDKSRNGTGNVLTGRYHRKFKKNASTILVGRTLIPPNRKIPSFKMKFTDRKARQQCNCICKL